MSQNSKQLYHFNWVHIIAQFNNKASSQYVKSSLYAKNNITSINNQNNKYNTSISKISDLHD